VCKPVAGWQLKIWENFELDSSFGKITYGYYTIDLFLIQILGNTLVLAMGQLSIDLGDSVKEIFGEKSSLLFCSSLTYLAKKRIVYANSFVLFTFSITYLVIGIYDLNHNFRLFNHNKWDHDYGIFAVFIMGLYTFYIIYYYLSMMRSLN
jgi:hypothetical protein